MLGSVEWVEAHVDELKKHAVAYVNSDGNERGFLFPGGTQDLQTFISGVARDIQDPETHMSVFQRSHLASIAKAKNADERSALRKRGDLEVKALGDGSDFTAFQDFAGISTLSVEFGDEDDGDQYHSIYDDFYWYTHFVDTDFSYGRALAQTAGTAMMRLAGADLIPVDYAPQAEAIAKYEADLEKLLKDKQDEFTERNLELQEGVFTATADPRKPSVPPPVEIVPPYMNFSPLKNAIDLLKKSSERYSKALAAWQAKGSPALSEQSLESGQCRRAQSLPPVSERERSSGASLVQKPDLRARRLHGLRGKAHRSSPRIYGRRRNGKKRMGKSRKLRKSMENVAAGISRAADDLEHAVAQSH